MKPSFTAALLLCAPLTACADASAERSDQAVSVGFVAVQPSQVPVTVSLGGRTVPFEISEVRPQVNGLVKRRLFSEGTYVRAGQPLYQIDARLYRAAVNQAEANLASARASATAATELANRYRPLAAQEAISQQELTNAEAQARVAQATIRQNAAALDTARINLRFATNRANQRPDRSLAFHHRGTGDAEPGRSAGRHPAHRSDLCRYPAIEHGAHHAAPLAARRRP